MKCRFCDELDTSRGVRNQTQFILHFVWVLFPRDLCSGFSLLPLGKSESLLKKTDLDWRYTCAEKFPTISYTQQNVAPGKNHYT